MQGGWVHVVHIGIQSLAKGSLSRQIRTLSPSRQGYWGRVGVYLVRVGNLRVPSSLGEAHWEHWNSADPRSLQRHRLSSCERIPKLASPRSGVEQSFAESEELGVGVAFPSALKS